MEVQRLMSEAEWLQGARACLRCEGANAEAQDPDLTLVSVRSLSGDGQVLGFMCDCACVRVAVRTGGVDGVRGVRELAMFVKMAPRTEGARQRMVLDSGCARNENVIYARLFPQMERALDAGRLPSPSPPLPGRPWAPRCFLARDDLLLLEDLSAQGFRSPGNAHALNAEECDAALAALAAFHAGSLALEAGAGASLPDLFPGLFRDFFLSPGECLHKFFLRGVDVLAHLVGQVPALRHAQQRLTPALKAVARRLAGASAQHRNVACHGDVWISNLMVRSAPPCANGAPEGVRERPSAAGTEVRLLDFQLPTYAPPAQDVVVLLYTCTRRALRHAHAQQLCDRYYTALERHLAGADLRAEDILPRAAFDASLSTYAPLGRMLAAVFHSNHLLPQEILKASVSAGDDQDNHLLRDRVPLAHEAFATDAVYRERLLEDLTDIVEMDIDAAESTEEESR